MEKIIKWGIIAPGNIAETFAASIASMDDAVLAAVASRNLDRARDFASRWKGNKAYGSYAELVEDPEVHAVYISSPHRYHREQIELALNHGKHVLCEKPITVNAAEFKPLAELAAKKGLFLMEAMWSRFLPTYQKLRNWISEGRLGQIKRIEADFSFSVDYDPRSRLFDPELAGGALLDVGIYPITLALWVMGRAPDEIVSLCRKAATGVDCAGTIVFQWDNDSSAVLNMGVDVRGPMSAAILGTGGMVELPRPFFGGETMIFRNESGEEIFEEKHDTNGFDYEIREAMKCIREGVLESSDHSWASTQEVLELMDGIRSEWEIRYPFE